MKPSPGILITQISDLDPEGGRRVVPILWGNSSPPHLSCGGKFIRAIGRALELHRGFGDGSCLSRKDLPQGMKLFSNVDVFISRAG